MALKNNTWKLNQWYDQNVAGNATYSGAGELWVWGSNEYYGQLGLNQPGPSYKSSPVQVPGTTWNVVTMFGGVSDSRSLATKTDGTLWAWGWNNTGGLGQNNRTEYNSPVQVGSGTDWSTGRGKVASSSSSGFAIKTDAVSYTHLTLPTTPYV